MAGTFALDISRFAQKANGRMDLVVRKISLDLFRRIILRSPVDTGRFRGNWQVAVGNISEGTIELAEWDQRKASDKAKAGGRTTVGSATLSAASAVVAQVKAGDVISLVNNLPYARRLEYGWSKQAPNGMVRITLAEYQGIVAAAAE